MTVPESSVTPESVTVSRARANPSGWMSRLSRVTNDDQRDVTLRRDSDTPRLDGGGVTITDQSKSASKLAQARRRFGAILASMSAEEQARFEREVLR